MNEEINKVEAEKQENNSFKEAWGKIVKFFKPWYIPTVVSTIFAAVAVIIMLFGPMQIRDMVDYILIGAMGGGDTHAQVVSIGWRLIILYGTSFILSFVANYIIAGSIQKAVVQLRRRTSQKINRVPLSYHDTLKEHD